VARIANGFEMKVLGYDVHQDKKLAKKLGFTYTSFEDLLKNSDIVTLHVPYNKNTHHLLNAGNIATMKKGAYLINTSRGGVVETDALVQALNSGNLAGAGLDVLEEEDFLHEEAHLLSKDFSSAHNLKTVLEDHILMEKDNVIITPHNAFNTKEAIERILETTVENIQGFINNKPINLVI
jgi:D-lactate dehydrogenase